MPKTTEEVLKSAHFNGFNVVLNNKSDYGKLWYSEDEVKELLDIHTKLTVDKSAEKDIKELFEEELQKKLNIQAKEIFYKIEITTSKVPYSVECLRTIWDSEFMKIKNEYIKKERIEVK